MDVLWLYGQYPEALIKTTQYKTLSRELWLFNGLWEDLLQNMIIFLSCIKEKNPIIWIIVTVSPTAVYKINLSSIFIAPIMAMKGNWYKAKKIQNTIKMQLKSSEKWSQSRNKNWNTFVICYYCYLIKPHIYIDW